MKFIYRYELRKETEINFASPVVLSASIFIDTNSERRRKYDDP